MGFVSTQFNDFFNQTRQDRLQGPDDVWNVTARTSYPFFALISRRPKNWLVQGGSGIVNPVKISDVGTFGAYTPGDKRTIQSVNVIAVNQYNWGFFESHVAWTDAEAELQIGNPSFTNVQNFANTRRMAAEDEHGKGLDSTLWAQPDATRMESISGTTKLLPYSIPAWITEDDPTLANATYNTRVPPGWATTTANLGGINTLSYAAHANAVSYYDHNKFTDPFAGVLPAFDDMWVKVGYRGVSQLAKSTNDSMPDAFTIFTNRNGIVLMKMTCRQYNDRLSQLNDPSINGLAFDGVPFVHSPVLDSALLEQTRAAGSGAGGATGVGAYTSAAYSAGKPRYFVINTKTLGPVFKQGHMMQDKAIMKGPIDQRDVNVLYTESWFNTVCAVRNRNGVIAPLVGG